MRKTMLGIMAATALTSAGCGRAHGEEDNSPQTSRSYPVGQFDKVELAGAYNVTIATGKAPSVSAVGSEKALERMVVEVEGGVLKIHPDKHRGFSFGWSRSKPVRLTITTQNLAGAELAGSGDINIDRVQGESFDGSVAGSGDLRIAQIDVQRLKMEIAGSGSAQAAGRSREADYGIAGSGDIKAANVASETAKVSIAGSGNVTGQATRTASVDIMGSGNVRLTGGAQCKISKAGSGNVDCS